MNRPLPHRGARRGSSYVAVLGLSMLVVAIALGGALATRSDRAASTLRDNEGEARAAGYASVEWAAQVLAADSSWRAKTTSGTYTDPVAFDNATLSYSAVDEVDGVISGNPLQPFRLYGLGRTGSAARVFSVGVEPTGPTLDVLGLPLYTERNLTVGGTVYGVGGPLVCGNLLTVSLLATLDGSAECLATLNLLGTVTGGYKTGIAPRTLPSQYIHDSYSAMGTTIAFGMIPSGNMTARLVTATNNPFGVANERGVYIITVPASSTLTITNCRTECTFVINLGAASRLVLSGANLCEPPAGGSPTFIIRGTASSAVTINGSLTPLSETTAATNFNPTTSPHGQSSDTDTADTYPAMVRGVVHIMGTGVSVTVTNDALIRGCLITEGSVSASGAATFIADPHLATSPPWGYFDPTMLSRVPGTWRRDAAP